MKLHVIVHEYAVETEASLGKPKAQEVSLVIQAIRKDELFRVIGIDGAPRILDPNMPAPSDELEVQVSGAYKDCCVASQLYALRKAGYNARFHPAGCLVGEKELPETIRNYILQEFPNFFD